MGRMKQCPQCQKVKLLSDYKDDNLKTGFGRHCNECKGLAVASQKEAREEKTTVEEVAEGVKCPSCGSAMAIRKRRRDGRNFYGCKRFPLCRGTKPF